MGSMLDGGRSRTGARFFACILTLLSLMLTGNAFGEVVVESRRASSFNTLTEVARSGSWRIECTSTEGWGGSATCRLETANRAFALRISERMRQGFPRPDEEPQFSISLATRVAVGQVPHIVCGEETIDGVVSQRAMDNYFREEQAAQVGGLLNSGRRCSLRYQRVGGDTTRATLDPSGFADSLTHARNFIRNFR